MMVPQKTSNPSQGKRIYQTYDKDKTLFDSHDSIRSKSHVRTFAEKEIIDLKYVLTGALFLMVAVQIVSYRQSSF